MRPTSGTDEAVHSHDFIVARVAVGLERSLPVSKELPRSFSFPGDREVEDPLRSDPVAPDVALPTSLPILQLDRHRRLVGLEHRFRQKFSSHLGEDRLSCDLVHSLQHLPHRRLGKGEPVALVDPGQSVKRLMITVLRHRQVRVDRGLVLALLDQRRRELRRPDTVSAGTGVLLPEVLPNDDPSGDDVTPFRCLDSERFHRLAAVRADPLLFREIDLHRLAGKVRRELRAAMALLPSLVGSDLLDFLLPEQEPSPAPRAAVRQGYEAGWSASRRSDFLWKS